MQKWEYKIVNLSASQTLQFPEELNKLGDEGWEAVGISSYSQTYELPKGVILLKRPKA